MVATVLTWLMDKIKRLAQMREVCIQGTSVQQRDYSREPHQMPPRLASFLTHWLQVGAISKSDKKLDCQISVLCGR
jgi:hypothetical protein